MVVRVAIRHDEPDAKSAIEVKLIQTHSAPGFGGLCKRVDVILPGFEHSFDVENGVHLHIEECPIPISELVAEPVEESASDALGDGVLVDPAVAGAVPVSTAAGGEGEGEGEETHEKKSLLAKLVGA